MFYAPIIPQAIPMCLLSCFITYWTSKYSLLRRYRMPNMFGDLMATFFANLMPWVVLGCSIGAVFFFFELEYHFNETGDDDEDNEMNRIP